MTDADRRLSTLAEKRSDQFDTTICLNYVYESIKHQNARGPDIRRYITVAEDVYELSADEDLDDRRLDVFGAAETINDHVDDVADEVIAAALADLLEVVDDWDDAHDQGDIDAAKQEARGWLQGHHGAAERAGVWEEVTA